jgi:hypothetical protein
MITMQFDDCWTCGALDVGQDTGGPLFNGNANLAYNHRGFARATWLSRVETTCVLPSVNVYNTKA